MTNYPFQPSSQGPYQFQPTLDGSSYLVTVTWNTFDQRWYFNLYDNSGVLVVSKALVGSDAGANIQGMSWSRGVVALTTVLPHGLLIGDTLDLTVSGCSPSAYNGDQQMLVTGLSTLTFSLSADPGEANAFGAISYDIDLIDGFGFTSKIVFRQTSQQFEVTP